MTHTQVSPAPKRPATVVHADWGKQPRKRWMARARLMADGGYRAEASQPVGDAGRLFEHQREDAPDGQAILFGFDFPIGLPAAFARAAGIDDFIAILPSLGTDRWARFFDVAEQSSEIAFTRPFYPMRPGGTRRAHLSDALHLDDFDQLRRRCERAGRNRRAACPVFWTLGGQQVGKAAISGWKEVLIPALQSDTRDVAIWPFSGALSELLEHGDIVVAETYPAGFYAHLGVRFGVARAGERSGKRVQDDRRANAEVLLRWASEAGVEIASALREEIEDGFGARSDGEDRFDAVVGLLGMLNVTLGLRSPGNPEDDEVRRIEGWILGQEAE